MIDFNINDFIMEFKQTNIKKHDFKMEDKYMTNVKPRLKEKNFKHFIYPLHYYNNTFINKNGVKKVYD